MHPCPTHDCSAPRRELTPPQADRRRWGLPLDPAQCRPAVRALFSEKRKRPRKLWGRCGTVLADGPPRCRATNRKSNRRHPRPAEPELDFAARLAHRTVVPDER